MQTNFFRQIAKMNLSGDLQITFTPTTENNFVVSVLLKNEQCGDTATGIFTFLCDNLALFLYAPVYSPV